MGGRKISDHGGWPGKGLPDGVKKQSMSHGTGDGELSTYEDTAEAKKAQQEAGVSKMKSKTMKPGYKY